MRKLVLSTFVVGSLVGVAFATLSPTGPGPSPAAKIPSPEWEAALQRNRVIHPPELPRQATPAVSKPEEADKPSGRKKTDRQRKSSSKRRSRQR